MGADFSKNILRSNRHQGFRHLNGNDFAGGTNLTLGDQPGCDNDFYGDSGDTSASTCLNGRVGCFMKALKRGILLDNGLVIVSP